MSSHVLSAAAIYGAAFIIAGIVSLLGTPLLVRLATRLGIVDAAGEERRMHDLPNVVVADSSVFVTSAGYGPTLTLVALAARAATALVG